MRKLNLSESLLSAGAALAAVAASALLSALLMLLIGISPSLAWAHFFRGIFGSAFGLGETLNRFIPLLCCALGFSVAQQSGFFNLGGEGQLAMGALGAALCALYLPPLPVPVQMLLSLLAGMAAGALLCAVAGVLKFVFQANELLSTILLNYLSALFLSLLVAGPLKDPASALEQTAAVPARLRLPALLPGSRLHAGLIIALLAACAVWFFLRRTVPGFELRLTGANAEAARYAGVSLRRSAVLAVLISGGLAGLGGGLDLLGNQYRLMDGFSSGYGFDALGIAVMGRFRPVGMLLSSLLFAALRVGAGSMQRGAGVPLPMLHVLQGILILSVLLSHYFARRLLPAMMEGGDAP